MNIKLPEDRVVVKPAQPDEKGARWHHHPGYCQKTLSILNRDYNDMY